MLLNYYIALHMELLILFNLQEPVAVKLGTRMESTSSGTLTECKDTFQYIPLYQSLRSLLQNVEVCDEVSLVCYYELTIIMVKQYKNII